MKEIIATVKRKGQILIPVEVRKHLGVEPGDKIVFYVGEEGQIILKRVRYPTVASLRGAAGKLAQPLSWEEMRQIARDDYIEAAYRRV